MRAPRLGVLLSLALAVLVAAGVAGTALSGIGTLHRLAADQARARVRAAAAAAVETARAAGDDLATSARVLAERPTLQRLLKEGDVDAARTFLERFAAAGALDGCAVLLGTVVIAGAGVLPAPGSVPEAAGWTVVHGAPGGPVLLAVAPLATAQAAERVVAVQRVDAAFAESLSLGTGLAVRVLDPRAAGTGGDPVASQAAITESPAEGRPQDAFLAAWPLRVGGRVAAVVEVALPAGALAGPLAAEVRALTLWAIGVGAVAILAGLLLGRLVAAPLEGLTRSADRIGRGDLATPVPRSGGREVGALAETMDQMRARLLQLTAALRRRSEEVEAVLGGIVEGVFTVDADRRIRFLNPQAAAMLGASAAEALGKFCGDVLRPEEEPTGRPCERDCPILQARFRGSVRRVEHLSTPSGSRSVVVTSAAPGEEGRQVQLLRDETENEAVRRLRDGVLANLSHEFKTPLSAQLASLELLRERLGEPVAPDTVELVAALERGTLRLTGLVDNLLESVRLEAGIAGIRRSPVQIDEVVEDAAEAMGPLLRQRGQSIEVELPWPLPRLSGDAARLTQVFVNLLANANKYAPAGSTIRVGGAVREGRAVLWVQDEGPGLPPDAARKLFERFVRGRTAAGEEPAAGGMGLGLWIARSIVERHGGLLEAESDGPGTRMCVILPIEEAA